MLGQIKNNFKVAMLVVVILAASLLAGCAELDSVTGSGSSSGTTNATYPAIGNAVELSLSPDVVAEFEKGFNSLRLSGGTVKLYGGDLDAAKMSLNTDVALINAKYQLGLPGFPKPVDKDGSGVAFYTLKDAPDIMVVAAAVASDPEAFKKAFGLPSLNTAAAQKMIDQLKGYKSAIFVTSAPNLSKALLSGGL